jgi:hypothetical protein
MKARHKKRAAGGAAMSESDTPLDAGGNPNVKKEAAERKRGGRSMKAEGGPPKNRIDKYKRGGRATGGRTGSDKNPLTSAANVKHVGSTAGSECK